MREIFITREWYGRLTTWNKIKFWFKVWASNVLVVETKEAHEQR
jgi:hypothetical protein